MKIKLDGQTVVDLELKSARLLLGCFSIEGMRVGAVPCRQRKRNETCLQHGLWIQCTGLHGRHPLCLQTSMYRAGDGEDVSRVKPCTIRLQQVRQLVQRWASEYGTKAELETRCVKDERVRMFEDDGQQQAETVPVVVVMQPQDSTKLRRLPVQCLADAHTLPRS